MITNGRPQGWGTDLAAHARPGVPREAPGEFDRTTPSRQPLPDVPLTRRMELSEFTPVFGTAQPPRGLSGLLRRAAYRIPEHKARRWLLLLGADRADVLEHSGRGRYAVLALAAMAVTVRAVRSSARARSRRLFGPRARAFLRAG